MYDGRRIYRLAVTQCRFKTHSVCGRNGSFIEAVPKGTKHPVDPQLSVCAENDFQKHFTFEFELASFLGINRVRLIGDFYRGCCGSAVRLLEVNTRFRHLLGCKT